MSAAAGRGAAALAAHHAARDQIVAALAEVSGAARTLGVGTRAAALDEVAARLREDSFRILVVGEFKRGKSTLINAMLGEALLPARLAPCTALITRLRAGPAPRVRLHPLDPAGAVVELPPARLAEVLRLPPDGGRMESPWAWVEVEHPLPLLAGGVELIDSPGLNEHADRDRVALGALPRADALVLVLSAEMPLGPAELELIDRELADRAAARTVFFVWNRYDALDGDPEAQAALWAASAALLGPRLAPTPSAARVFALSARPALRARQAGDAAALAASGLPAFEDALRVALAEERGQLKRAGPARAGARAAEALRVDVIPARRRALGAPIQALEDSLAARAAWRDRLSQRRRRLAGRLALHAAATREAVRAAVAQLSAHLRAQAPQVAAGVELGPLLAALRPDEAERRVAEALRRWVEQTLRGWAEGALIHALAALRDQLVTDLNDELRAFFHELDGAPAATSTSTALALRGPDPLDELLGRLGADPGAEDAPSALLGGLPVVLGAALTLGALALVGPLAAAVTAGISVVGAVLSGRSAAERAAHDAVERLRQALAAALPRLEAELLVQADRRSGALSARIDDAAAALIADAAEQVDAAHAALRAGRATLAAALADLDAQEATLTTLEAQLRTAAGT